LRDLDPTDPQAEILVLQTIEPDLITGVAFHSVRAANSVSHLRGNRKLEVYSDNNGLFGTRGFARNFRS
jgi:hypothetical protein